MIGSARDTAWYKAFAVVFAAGVILALNMGLRQTFGLFIDPMNQAIGISVTSFSLAIAIQNLLWGAMTPVCGALADRYGTGRMLVVGGLTYALGLAVTATAQSDIGVHLGAGILVGFAVAASGFPLALAAVSRLTPPEKRSAALGMASAGGSAGQFLLLPATQELIGVYGWSTALFVLAAASLLIVPLAAKLAGRAGDDVSEANTGADSLRLAVGEAVRHRGFLLLTSGFFVCGFHVAFVGTHLPNFVIASELPAMIGATGLSIIGFFNIVGTLIGGVLGGRYRKKYLLCVIYLLRSAAIGYLMLVPTTATTVYIFSALFGLLWLSTVPLTGALVGQIFGPRYMATLFGIVMLSHQMGAFLGAWLGGVSFDLTGGYDSIWYIAAALGVLAAVLHAPIGDRPLSRAPRPVGS